jgi:flagellar biosynthesis/type III secretory pathway chaperone
MLSKFSPIIDLTNYLIKKLNLTLKRDEARIMRIAQLFDDPEDGQHIKALWDRFVEAWNSLNF